MVYNRLKELQAQKKFTNKEVADAVGRSRQWYSDIFTTKSLKIEDLKLLAELYKVDMKVFFEDSYKDGDTVYDPNLYNEYNQNINELVNLNRKSLETLLDLTMQLKASREENKKLLLEIEVLKSELRESKNN